MPRARRRSVAVLRPSTGAWVLHLSAQGLASLARLLDEIGVAYALIGAHAVNVWLEPRFTADVDLTGASTPQEMQRLRAGLLAAGFRIVREHGAALPSGPDFVRFLARDDELLLEVQAAKTSLQRELVERAVVSPSGLRVATVEDLIVLKLIADRPKDQGDLDGLARLPGIDWRYVERCALEWELEPRLRRLRAESAGAESAGRG